MSQRDSRTDSIEELLDSIDRFVEEKIIYARRQERLYDVSDDKVNKAREELRLKLEDLL